jgi:KaiC/GvpD/RAD55 family RecA-like ATPase
MVTQRITTGIPGLDNLTGGGFEPHSINLVAGGGGSGNLHLHCSFY